MKARLLLAAVLAFAPLLAAAEPATLMRAVELKKEPATDAAKVADLAENAKVDALERSGGWVRVKSAAGEGWVKLLALRYGGTARAGDSGLQQALNVARTGSSGTQVTTGVRGLDEEQISRAQPNPAELKKLQGYAETKQASSGFAESGKLKAQRVEYPK
jgi:SH3 domain-containing protein